MAVRKRIRMRPVTETGCGLTKQREPSGYSTWRICSMLSVQSRDKRGARMFVSQKFISTGETTIILMA